MPKPRSSPLTFEAEVIPRLGHLSFLVFLGAPERYPHIEIPVSRRMRDLSEEYTILDSVGEARRFQGLLCCAHLAAAARQPD